jgi:hypothetical protein
VSRARLRSARKNGGEQARLIGGVDPDPPIAHLDLDAVRRHPCGQNDGMLGVRVLARVVEQVVERAAQQRKIGGKCRQFGLGPHVEPAAGMLGLEACAGLGKEILDRNRLPPQRRGRAPGPPAGQGPGAPPSTRPPPGAPAR